jgi:RHS repeat-associated protein
VRAESLTATLVYTYNAQGLRVTQAVDGDVTTFAWDWASGLPEMLSDGDNLYLVGHETLGTWDGAAWAYHLPDALGSVRQMADAAGAVVSGREWTPYGVEVGAGQAGLGYTGEWWDADVGLEYLRARWYDGRVGRFTRRDEWGGSDCQPQSLHSYVYVGNSPLNQTDPAGHWWYDPINDRLVNMDNPRVEAPFHPKITFYPDTNPYLERDDVFDWIIPRAQQISAFANWHGVPSELVAGILAVELEDDTERRDVEVDNRVRYCMDILQALGEWSPQTLGEMWEASSLGCVCGGLLWGYADVATGIGLPLGYGIANIHISREGLDWGAVVQHYEDQEYVMLPLWVNDPVWMLLRDAGAIEGAAMFGRGLADARTGVNAPHRSDLTLDDMAMIFVGYRFGVGGFTDVLDLSYAFPTISDFQDFSRSDLPVHTDPRYNAQRNFDIARPYFDAFQFYFEYRDLYEAEYGDQW